MLVYYFVPFIASNRYLLFRDSNGHNSVTVQNRTHVFMNFFDHKDKRNHQLKLCPKVVKHPVYVFLNACICVCICLNIFVYVFMHVCMDVLFILFSCVYVCLYICVFMCIYMRVGICLCLLVYM